MGNKHVEITAKRASSSMSFECREIHASRYESIGRTCEEGVPRESKEGAGGSKFSFNILRE